MGLTMKKLLAFIACLLLLSFNASAQVPLPTCYATVNGNHQAAPRYTVNGKGIYTHWFCINRKNEVEVWGTMCRHADCAQQAVHEAHTAVLKATAKVRTANEQWAKHIKFFCDREFAKVDTSNGRLCAEWWAIFDANKAAWLPGVP